jgi:hypothetical protein
MKCLASITSITPGDDRYRRGGMTSRGTRADAPGVDTLK